MKFFQIMHTEFRTAVISSIGVEENGTKKGVTGNFHTNWAVLLLMPEWCIYRYLLGKASVLHT